MAEKNLKARIVHKHDVEANWLLATNFTPLKGELIVYDIDETHPYERIKIGDGVQNVNDLPFYNDGFVSYNKQELTDEQKAQARANISKYEWHEVTSNFGTYEVALDDSSIDWESLVSVDDASGYMTGTPAISILAGTSVSLSVNFSAPTGIMQYYISPELDAIFASGAINSAAFLIYVKDEYDDIYSFTYSKYNENQNAISIGHSPYGLGSVRYDKQTSTITYNVLKAKFTDESLSYKGYHADAKATGDAINAVSALVGDTSVSEQINTAITESVADWNQNDETAADYIKNKPEIATDDEIIELLMQEDMFPVVQDSDGSVLADENDNILLW